MDLLLNEIARKRKAVDMAKASASVKGITSKFGSSGNRTSTKKKRFLKASELRRFEEEELEKARTQSRKDVAENENTNHGRNAFEDYNSSTTEKDPKTSTTKDVSQLTEKSMQEKTSNRNSQSQIVVKEENGKNPTSTTATQKSPTEITNMLRSLGLPVRLFGEKTVLLDASLHLYDDSQRERRLLSAQEKSQQDMASIRDMDEFKLGSGHGINNPFLGSSRRNTAAEEEDESSGTDRLPPLKKGTMSSSSFARSSASSQGTTNQGLATAVTKAKKTTITNDEDVTDDPHKRIYRYFKSLLKQWEEDLASRPETAKRTAQGKNETKTLKQCKDYIRPLFRLCKDRNLEGSLLTRIYNIVLHCEEGEFVKAHDVYNDVAIGRAAWPIGVTMVGIHARSGRAKIESGNVAHVMNSELQRKYLTSVKRLMTYNQKKRTDVAPSKKVMS